MRVAITANTDSPESPVDGRFAAARYILVFDTADGKWEAVKLSLWSRQQKYSGKIRASILKEQGIDALISGGVDPTAFKELGKRSICIFQAPDSPAREAAEMLVRGCLPILQVPDAIDVAKFVKRHTASSV
jgi:predicted Fe-Mo cluster-binding NifX family protein